MRGYRGLLILVSALWAVSGAAAGGSSWAENMVLRADLAYQDGRFARVEDLLEEVYGLEQTQGLSDTQYRRGAGLLADVYWRTGEYQALLAHSKRHQPERIHQFWSCLVREARDPGKGRRCWSEMGDTERTLRAIRSQLLPPIEG